MSESTPDTPVVYAVRLFERARRDIEAAASRIAEMQDDITAANWLDGMENELAKLATNPRRFPYVPEAKEFGKEMRQMLYRRTPGSVAYRVIFFPSDRREGDVLEPPTVFVIHVRHASRRPIARREARNLTDET